MFARNLQTVPVHRPGDIFFESGDDEFMISSRLSQARFAFLVLFLLLLFPTKGLPHREPVTVSNSVREQWPHDDSKLDLSDRPAPAPDEPNFDFISGGSRSQRGPASENSAKNSAGFPHDVSEGFVLKVVYKKETQATAKPAVVSVAYWVVKRDDHFDMLYANSRQSQGSFSLSAEIFLKLQGFIQELKPTTLNVSRCQQSNIRLDALVGGKIVKTVVSCISDKGSDADHLRGLANSLSSLVE